MKKYLLFFAILIAFGCTESYLTFNPTVAISDGTPELIQAFGGSKNDVKKDLRDSRHSFISITSFKET